MTKRVRFFPLLRKGRGTPPSYSAPSEEGIRVSGKPLRLWAISGNTLNMPAYALLQSGLWWASFAKPERSTIKRGRLGDVSGRPNENDLREIAGKTYGVLKQLALI